MDKAKSRRPLLLLAVLALLAGLWGGLLRMGWQLPHLRSTLIMAHGPLMVCGFLGTLIGLERAVALGKIWAYATPVLCGVGGVLAIAGVGGVLPLWLFLAGSLVLLAMFIEFVTRQKALSMYIMLLGAVLWAVGNGLWLAGRPIFDVSLWWVGFIALTILGERWGFSRMMSPPRGSKWLFGLSVVVSMVGLAIAMFNRQIGTVVLGAGLLFMSDWFLMYDISRRTLAQRGLSRYVAISIQTGALWLGIGGLLMVFHGEYPAGLQYDAILHTVFLGFAFSMIFGHAPLIFPAVLKLPIEFNRFSYVPLILLNASLVARVAGDLIALADVRAWGGMMNAAAIILFFGGIIASVIRAKSQRVS